MLPVRTASSRRFYRVPTIYVLSRNMKNIRLFYLNIYTVLVVKFSVYLNRRYFVMWYRSVRFVRGMFEMNCLFLSGDFKFQVSPKYSFHALEVLPVARNAKFQLMYPLLEGVTVRWFGHSNKVLMNGRFKCLSGLVFPPSNECFQFRKQKEITWGRIWGIREVRQNRYFFFLLKRRNYCGGVSWGIVM